MDCPEKKELITRYVSCELSRSLVSELEEHIEDCSSCREDLAAAKQLEEILSSSPLTPVPPGLGNRLRESLDQLEREEFESRVVKIVRDRRRLFIRKDILPVGAFSAAAVFVSIALAYLMPPLQSVLFQLDMSIIGEGLAKIVTPPSGDTTTNLVSVTILLSLLCGLYFVSDRAVPIRIRWRDALPF